MASRLGLAIALSLAFSACASLQSEAFKGTVLTPSPAPDFTLTDDSGSPWTLSKQRGKTIALFFGYTHCPDTCPLTLTKLSHAAAQQGSRASDVVIALVTVDPQRDTPAVLKRYVEKFPGAAIVGLTGTAAQIAGVERSYHVWAQKIPGKHRGGAAYDDAHSSVTYLIDRNGRQRVLHNDDDALGDFADDIRLLVQ